MIKNKKLKSSKINWGQATVDALREETKKQKKTRDSEDAELHKAAEKAGKAFVANLNRKVKEGK